ncbi:MAG: hypothetical protein ACK46O_01300 [Flavobacteriia bacterium]|jgi:hypothetical protein
MKKLLFYTFSILSLSSCVKNNPSPAWIQVNEWTLIANADLSGAEGELTHNFSDAWVYVNDELMGVFEVPCKIPVLKSGNCNIKVYPTVRNNGISATKKIYPFVAEYEINADLVQNEVLTINPITRYKTGLDFWIEDFEDAAPKFTSDPTSASDMISGSDPNILQWGNFYGVVQLNAIDSTWIAYTQNDFINWPRGQELYLEVDYFSTNDLVTGVIGISATEVKNNINYQINRQDPATVKWKKIYIEMKEIVGNSPNAEYFKISLQAGLDPGDANGFIILDNIKVVHF